ncbi:MAG: hypothetical protein ABEJ08_00800 [Halobacteriaceae archaeon]
MLIDKTFDKPYPEEPECQANESDCTFDVDTVCHECGKPLCAECTVGIRHQPHLAKYVYTTGGEEKRVQQHCPDCIETHTLNTQHLGVGAGSAVLGLLLLWAVGLSSLVVALLALALLAGGGYLLRHEYWLKERLSDEYGLTSLF